MWKAPAIMVTIGPTLERQEDLVRAIEAGARWFRLPCGYRQRPHVENARAVRRAAAQTGTRVQLLLDLPSSRPRTGSMGEMQLEIGAKVRFWDPEQAAVGPEANGAAPVPLPGLEGLIPKLARRQRMWFCDGRLEFVVDAVYEATVLAHLKRGAIALKSSNAIYLPDSDSPYAVVTPPDEALLDAMAGAGIVPDWVALSLIASASDVRDGSREVRQHTGKRVKIMAKFETTGAMDDVDAIIAESDGIMVARGDFGPAVEFVRLPEAQERLVAAARRVRKVAVVATQALEVFAETGLPQRAELSDLSLMAQQRADAVMLGKETVYSPRPIETIRFAREVLTYETRRFEKAQARPRRPAASRRGK